VRLHRDVWWLLGSTIAAIAAAPLLVHGDAQTSAHRTAAAQKIEQLSPAERHHLEENFKRYEKLTPAEQSTYREIHSKIAANPAVAEALVVFSRWWPTVSPQEQAALFRTSDVKERVERVSQVQEVIDGDRSGRLVGRRWGRDWPRPESILPRESFYQIMEALEGLASESYSITKELPEIQKIDARSPERYLKLVTALQQHQQSWPTLVSTPAAENRVVESISDPAAKEMFKRMIGERWFGFNRGYQARSVLVMSLAKELYREGLQQSYGEDVLRKRIDGLSKEDKAELYSSTGDDARSQLRRDMREAFNPAWDFFQTGGRPGDGRGRGGEGPQGRGDGGRGDSRDDRGQGRGEPPQRRPD